MLFSFFHQDTLYISFLFISFFCLFVCTQVRPGDILVRVNQTALLSDGLSGGGVHSGGGGYMSMAVGESHFDATIRALREFQNNSKSNGTAMMVGRSLRYNFIPSHPVPPSSIGVY